MALTAVGLRTAGVDEAITVLRALIEHRDDVIKTRTQTVNRRSILYELRYEAWVPQHAFPLAG